MKWGKRLLELRVNMQETIELITSWPKGQKTEIYLFLRKDHPPILLTVNNVEIKTKMSK